MAALRTDVVVGVVGAGAMGSGIAHVAAKAGHAVRLFDMAPGAAMRGKAAIEKDLRFLVGKGKLPAEACEAALARVTPCDRLEELAGCGLVVEAVVEDLSVKQTLFRELEELCGRETILATNTSSLSITAIGSALARPERLVGMHFFNPAPRMALVEVVSGLATNPALSACIHATATAWGKVAVHARSTPGFIVNRVARPYYAEALRVLAECAADPATLDAVLREGCGFPMGPFELMDLIGHDVNFAVTRSVFEAYFGDPRFAPSLIQQELVLAGRLGRKSGQGFYPYGEGAAKPEPAAEPPRAGVDRVRLKGEPGPLAALVARLEGAGVSVAREAGTAAPQLEIGDARLYMSDGRTATACAAESGHPDTVVLDLARDFAQTPVLTVARADTCGDEAFAAVVGTLQKTGARVCRLDDVAGLLAMRTVCMLANEAADGVVQGIGSAEDIDTAMRHGTNYPKGPLAWADELGVAAVCTVLDNLYAHYGDTRYRVSPLIRRRAASAGKLRA